MVLAEPPLLVSKGEISAQTQITLHSRTQPNPGTLPFCTLGTVGFPGNLYPFCGNQSGLTAN
jgi:hypothetical protein